MSSIRTRPRPASRKPHGRTYRIRRRCPFCGMIVNEAERFSWEHLFQTFEVLYAGRADVRWNQVQDNEYLEVMRAQFERLAPRLGYEVRRVAG